MKRFYIYLFISIPIWFSGCKKDKEVGPEKMLEDSRFLRSVKVAGAREVKIDTTENYIQIILPEQFKDDLIDIEVQVAPEAEIELPPWKPLYSPGHVKYFFKGRPTEHFTILRKSNAGALSKSYTVFILHEGPLSAELTSEIALYPSSDTTAGGQANIRFTSGLGSIPETPVGSHIVIPFIKHAISNLNLKGSFDAGAQTFFFDDILTFMDAEGTIAGVEYGNKTFLFPSTQKIKRGQVSVLVALTARLFEVFQTGETFRFDGGVFLESQKYTVKLQNYPHSSAIEVPAVVRNISTLEAKFPPVLPDDQYMASFFEGSQLIDQAPIVVSRDSAQKAIGQMWTVENESPSLNGMWNTEPITVQRGQLLFANPFPVILDESRKPFDTTKKVPDLALKANGKVSVLKAMVRGDESYADRSLRIYYGAYRIPENLPPGKYEATMKLGTNQYSLPFWGLIEIR